MVPTGPREARPDDRLRTRPQMRNCASGFALFNSARQAYKGDLPRRLRHLDRQAGPIIALDIRLVPWYVGNMKDIVRTQTGVRIESRLLKVLKALANELEISLGDLIEGIVLHAFEGKAPFSPTTLKQIKALRAVYGLELTAKDSHKLRETGDE